MTRFDFSPFYRTSVGFDRLFRLMDTMGATEEAASGYPPYNIEKTGEDAYRISIAVAGFDVEDLSVETCENQLVVTAKEKAIKKENDRANGSQFLHRGIASRAFRRTFHLADHVEVVRSHLENGLLHIELAREVPESMKPRRIEISTAGPAKIASKAKKLLGGAREAA